MAGQIAELAHDVLRRDFRSVDTRTARVLLVEAADRVLTSFPESLSRKAARALEQLGVTPLVGHTVVDVAAGSVAIRAPGGRGRARRRAHGDLGGGRHRLRARRHARGRGGPRRRPGRTGHRRARPHPPGSPGGVRARRHGEGAGRRRDDHAAPGRRPRRDAAGTLRRARGPRAAVAAARPAVPLRRQGQPRHDRPVEGGRRDQGRPCRRLPRLGALAARPSLLPDRLPEPAPGRSSAGRSASSPGDEAPD